MPKETFPERLKSIYENRQKVSQLVKEKNAEFGQFGTKKNLRQARYYKRQTTKTYRTVYRAYESNDFTITRDKLRQARIDKKVGKKVQAAAYRRNGGTLKRKTLRKAHQVGRNFAESAVQDNDYLEDIARTRQQIRQGKASYHQVKNMTRYARKITKGTVKGAYSLSNRGYNFFRGRGFTRTPIDSRWETAVAKRLNAIRARIARTKVAKGTKLAGNSIKVLTAPLRVFMRNPLSVWGLANLFFLLVIVAVLGGSSSTSQDEFDLSESWVHFTKIDRENSSSDVDYWSNIDDMLMLTNYKHKDYKSSTTWIDPMDKGQYQGNIDSPAGLSTTVKTMKDMEEALWKDLNGDKDNLLKVTDLIKDTKNPRWFLSPKESSEFEELQKVMTEMGKYRSYQDLEHPFYSLTDASSNSPITITVRYGYETKDEKFNGVILKAAQGQKLFTTMAGTLKLEQKDGKTSVIISDGRREFTYRNVIGCRFTDDSHVEAGQELGQVGSETGQTIYYRKLKDDKKGTKDDVWEYVNPGFYFAKVEYTQQTYLISSAGVEGDVAGRIKQAADLIRKYNPKATNKGIAAMLGNFWTESSINPKRAEGDYLSPPVGASGNSWDDPAWLAIGGPAIYNGGYPNIIHRGLGLGQWTDTTDGSVRQTALLNYAKSKNKKWYELELQIDFIFNGDNPYYRELVHNILTSDDDVESLTNRFLINWEGNRGDKLLDRQAKAKAVLNYLSQPTNGSGQKASSFDLPPGYKGKFDEPTQKSLITQPGSGYKVGECTWYVYNRLVETGQIPITGEYGYLQNGGYWVQTLVRMGWKYSTKPVKGAVLSVAPGFDTTGTYGHVAYVEYVNPDGSFLISECNYAGVRDKIHYRVLSPAPYYTFAYK